MASEVASALWRKARVGEIEPRAAGVLLANVPDMPVHWGADETVSADAVRLALALDHPVYDCMYLALAPPRRREGGDGGPSIRECARPDRAWRVRPDPGRLCQDAADEGLFAGRRSFQETTGLHK